MAGIRASAPERAAKVEAQGVTDELSRAEREHRQMVDEQVRLYNGHLHNASKVVHELLVYMQTLSRVHGTQLLEDMRSTDVLGLITVQDDMERLHSIGSELMEAVKLARTLEPPTGINMATVNI